MPELGLITNEFTNQTDYTFTPNGNSALSAGNWVISPQPIGLDANAFVAFQAQCASGTTTGAVGVAGYDVIDGNGNNVGTLTLDFSDPSRSDNSASGSTTVPGLVVAASIPRHGNLIVCTWTAAASTAA
jgi:hypothetical protein